MVKITICRSSEGKLTSLLVEGHANSAPHGEDLVCAGVSAITFGGLNALSNPKDYKFDVKEGRVEVTIQNVITPHDEAVFDTMLIQYKTILEENPKFIKIYEKG